MYEIDAKEHVDLYSATYANCLTWALLSPSVVLSQPAASYIYIV